MALPDSALTGQDHFHSLHFSDPIVFELSVSVLDQKEFNGVRDFPSGSYFVAWDGVTIVVMWEQDSDQGVARSAGRIAIEVVDEAVKKAGLSTYIQACSPGCRNRFTHTDALIVPTGAKVPKKRSGLIIVEWESFESPILDLRRWYGQIAYRFQLFAIYKNHARRLRDLDTLISVQLQHLLHLRQKRQTIAIAGRKGRWARRRSLFGWKRHSRKYVADVWLAAASIELGRGRWDEERRRFAGQTKNSKTQGVFEQDIKDDAAAVDAIDLEFARSALEYSSARFDAQVLAVVTALAGASAIAGGAVGAALARLLT